MTNCTLIMERDLKLKELYPRFQARIEDFLNRLDRLDFKVGIFSGRRTPEEQHNLWLKGRDEKGNITDISKVCTYADRLDSFHVMGVACDIVWKDPYCNWTWKEPKEGDWDRIGLISKEFKLHWGGDFKGLIDKPHFEANFGLTLNQMKDIYGKSGLAGVWNELDKHG